MMRAAAYIGKLTSAGVDPKVAQAHGEALEEALGESYVTRDYLDRRLGEVEAKIAAVDAKIDRRSAEFDAKIERRIAELEAKMLRYMVTQTAAMAAILFGLLRLLR
jgi:hypothetical protein